MNSRVRTAIGVSEFTGGLVGPSILMLGPPVDGGTIIAQKAPGGWGPMITTSAAFRRTG